MQIKLVIFKFTKSYFDIIVSSGLKSLSIKKIMVLKLSQIIRGLGLKFLFFHRLWNLYQVEIREVPTHPWFLWTPVSRCGWRECTSECERRCRSRSVPPPSDRSLSVRWALVGAWTWLVTAASVSSTNAWLSLENSLIFGDFYFTSDEIFLLIIQRCDQNNDDGMKRKLSFRSKVCN